MQYFSLFSIISLKIIGLFQTDYCFKIENLCKDYKKLIRHIFFLQNRFFLSLNLQPLQCLIVSSIFAPFKNLKLLIQKEKSSQWAAHYELQLSSMNFSIFEKDPSMAHELFQKII